MRVFLSLVLLAISLLGGALLPTAQASVLLPDDNKDTNSSSEGFFPNLGLGSYFGLKSDKKESTTTQSPSTSAQRGTAPKTQSPPTTGRASSSSARVTQNPSFDRNLQLIQAAQAQRNMHPPLIIGDNAPVQDAAMAAKLPRALTISLSSSYYWGPNEIRRIGKAFGYDTQTLQNRCILRLGTLIMTEEGQYNNVIYPGQQTVTKYGGTVRLVNVVPRAICDRPAQLPQSGSTIEVVSDKYGVKLGQTLVCTVAGNMPPPSSLDLSYSGDGKGSCKFR